MALDQDVTLGRSGLRVSPLCLGAMTFGEDMGWGSSVDESQEIRTGKVRYIGVSDTPAWKVAEANITARFRGWSQFIGLQIECSLLERTVEAELVPMAQGLWLGITPWSPLRRGALSGKYMRAPDGHHRTDRGALLDNHLNEPTLWWTSWRGSLRRTTRPSRVSRSLGCACGRA